MKQISTRWTCLAFASLGLIGCGAPAGSSSSENSGATVATKAPATSDALTSNKLPAQAKTALAAPVASAAVSKAQATGACGVDLQALMDLATKLADDAMNGDVTALLKDLKDGISNLVACLGAAGVGFDPNNIAGVGGAGSIPDPNSFIPNPGSIPGVP